MLKLVIFDLDGTLLNTIGDLADATNYVLTQHNHPTHTLDEYNAFIGNGIRKLIERSVPEEFRTKEYLIGFTLEFLDYYKKHINEKTYPYKDIPLLLNTLQDNKLKLAVASNKFQEGVDFLLKYYFPEIDFAAAVGPGGDISTKPDPKMVNKILSTVNVSPDETLYLGDSNVDMITARNAGIKPIGVSWGYRTRKELEENGAWRIIDNPMDFYNLYVKNA
ncbi:MAG: HAD family hydrolase [Bacteroidales bacterium]|nr:HAD family hydrolase [Bacteroidales bacterium]